MPGYIFVPIHLHLLAVRQEVDVLEPDADFSALPGQADGGEDNPDSPYLSDEVLRPDFAPGNLSLGRGVHLHWTLPGAYRRGFQAADGSGRQWHAPAPNRWLITQYIDEPGAETRQWIVESDYLAPTARRFDGGQPTIPLTPGRDAASFARLGRQVALQTWLTDPGVHDRFRNLTALGYGNAAFAAFYPNCRNVFGFHDTGEAAPNSVYEVIGWHADPADELLAGFVTNARMSAGRTATDIVRDVFGWPVDITAGPVDPGDRAICFARTRLTHPGNAPARRAALAAGHTGTEALSAWLARQPRVAGRMGALTAGQIEERMEAVLLHKAVGHHNTDRLSRLSAARHEKSFNATPGGTRWTVQAGLPATATAQAPRNRDPRSPLRLPGFLSSLLDEVNRCQGAFDDAAERIESLRTRIFHDWHRYMAAMYRGEGPLDSLPDVDRIRQFMEQGDLAELAALEDAQGRIESVFGPDGRLAGMASQGAGETLAGRLSGAMGTLLPATEMLSTTGIGGTLEGGARFTSAGAERAHVLLADPASAVLIEHVDGCVRPDFGPETRLEGLTAVVSVRVAPGSEGVVLSWGAEDYFELSVRRQRAEGVLVFATTSRDRKPDVLISPLRVDDGSWHDVVALYSGASGRKAILIDRKVAAETSAHAGQPLGAGRARSGVLGAPDQGRAAAGLAIGYLRVETAALPDLAIKSPDLHWGPELELAVRPVAAARYWAPREPVLLITGDAAQQDGRYSDQQEGCVRISNPLLDWLWTGDAAQVSFALNHFRVHVDAVLVAGSRGQDGAHWYPFAMEWEAAFRPYRPFDPHASDHDHFAPEAIRTSFRLAPTEFDMRPSGDWPLSEHASIFTGRSFLTPHAKRALIDALENDKKRLPPDLAKLLDDVRNADFHVLSQALSGFNDALLQTRQCFQLPVADPLAFDEYRAFTEGQVRGAVARAGITAPRPALGFHPLRAGAVELRRLRLIDTFGQVLEIDTRQITRSTGLHDPDAPARLALAPRITQPARLDFRWLCAADASVEASYVADASPICGWMTPDFLDDVLMVHDADGAALGQLTLDPDHAWRSVPGEPRNPSMADASNPQLTRVLRWIARHDARFRGALIEMLRESLENIHPDSYAGFPDLALLMGRPLAVVRARLSLSLRGLPAVNQDWVAFRRDMQTRERDYAGVDRVRFPVRLGENHRVNDGLVCYWVEDSSGGLGSRLYIPDSDAAAPRQALIPDLVHPGDDDFLIELSLAGEPVSVTMLIDPRAGVHATTGVLPVKAIVVPPIHTAGALAQMAFSFQVAPVLSPRAALSVPLPITPGFETTWLARKGDAWQRTGADSIVPVEPHRTDSGEQQLIEGWLQLVPSKQSTRP